MRLLFLVSLFAFCSCTISNFDRGSVVPNPLGRDSLSFEMVKNLMVIEAEVNGVPGRFLVDNGFSYSALNADFAQKAKVEFEGKTGITDINGIKRDLQSATADSIRIAGYVFLKTGVISIDTEKFMACEELDGVIGASVMNKVNWLIQPKKLKMVMSVTPFEMDGLQLALSQNNSNSSFVELEIGGEELELKVDLGSGSELLARTSNFSEDFLNQAQSYRLGARSFSAHGLGKMDTIGTTKNRVALYYEGTQLSRKTKLEFAAYSKYDGYLGFGYLKQMNFALNLKERSLILGDKSGVEMDERSYGLAFYPVDGNWKVIQVSKDFPGVQENWLNNTITVIDTLNMKEVDLCFMKKYMREKRKKSEPIYIQFEEDIKSMYELPFIDQFNSLPTFQ